MKSNTIMTTDGLIAEREQRGGEQRIYKFPNGYGASVVRHPFSYGASTGRWELAVLTFPVYVEGAVPKFELCYDSPITDDVIGHLTEKEVNALLLQIKELS